MHEEIERKFLVKGDFKKQSTSSLKIVQGYLSTDDERSVRVRMVEEQGFLTIKGKSDSSGTTRIEWEREIPRVEAQNLLKLCLPGVIEKVRYHVPDNSGLKFEVDVFMGDNEGLIIAEIELPDMYQEFNKPEWLGKEVTGIADYYNSALSRKPFKKW